MNINENRKQKRESMTKRRQLPANTTTTSNVVTRSISKKDTVVPRRSSRLSSSVTITNPPKPSKRKKKSENKKPEPRKRTTNTYSGPPVTAEIRELFVEEKIKRSFRKFENRLYYGPNEEEKTYISSAGLIYSWTEKSSQHSWIAVAGTKTTCVVSMATRPLSQEMEEAAWCKENGSLPYPTLDLAMFKGLVEMIDSSGSFRQSFGHSHETGPIAVVCLTPGSIGDHQETNECQQASDAIKFLKEKLKHRSALTRPETLQIAVCALYYLFGPNFKSSAIEVCVSYGWEGFNGKLNSNDVKKCLDMINEGQPVMSSSSPAQ